MGAGVRRQIGLESTLALEVNAIRAERHTIAFLDSKTIVTAESQGLGLRVIGEHQQRKAGQKIIAAKAFLEIPYLPSDYIQEGMIVLREELGMGLDFVQITTVEEIRKWSWVVRCIHRHGSRKGYNNRETRDGIGDGRSWRHNGDEWDTDQ